MAIASPTSFLLFIFLHFHLLFKILAESSCPTSFDCQNLSSLKFPLSDRTRPDCGLFTVNCTIAPPQIQLQPIAAIWTPEYEILDIISPNKFHIRDREREEHLLNKSCYSFFNLSLPNNPSTSFTISSPNLTMFKCFKGPEYEDTNNKHFVIHDCPEFAIYYRNPANSSAIDERALPSNCQKFQLPGNPLLQHDSTDLFSLLTANFTLEWSISHDCMRCHEKGGQCDTNSMNEFGCLEDNHRQPSTAANPSPGPSSNAGSRSRIDSVRLALAICGGVLILVFVIVSVVLWLCKKRIKDLYLRSRKKSDEPSSLHNDTLEYALRGMNFQTSSFTYRQIKTATNSFSSENKIGEGGFGPVYKGTLSDGTVVAVKQLSSKSRQGNREFVTEIGMISAIQHPNLVKLYGCCVEGNNLLLVYEYMENNSLASALFSSEHYQLNLDWPTKHKICVGVARGLAYLHEESALKIVHRDIKASNVLLDKNLIPKISDFGLARLHEEDDTHISTRIAGTLGYMAPEYAMEGYLTDKADVYSFGVVLLEVVSGRANYPKPGEECNLLGQAKFLSQNDNLMELVDPRLESADKEEILATISIALICTNFVSAERPSMSTVVSMLTGSSTGSMSAPCLNMSAPCLNLFHVRPPGQGFTLIPVRSKVMYNSC